MNSSIALTASAQDIKNIKNNQVVIAFIDSGLEFKSHAELKDKAYINPKEIPQNQIDDDKNGFIDDVSGWNFLSETANTYPYEVHGEHVACIASKIAPNALLLPLKIFDPAPNDGTKGGILEEVEALKYLIDLQKSNHINHLVVNMSLSGQNYNMLERYFISLLENDNVILVFAAGNEGMDIDKIKNYTYPASFRLKNSITVGNIYKDKIETTSNYGKSTVDLFAPGTKIKSCLPEGEYGIMTGTSMSAPVVSGAVAALWALHPDWTSVQIREKLLKSVDLLPNLKYISVTSGVINLKKALE